MDYNNYDKGYGQPQGYDQQGYYGQQQQGYYGQQQQGYYGQQPYGYPQSAAQAQNERALASYVATVMQKVYVKMGLGLLLTAIISFLVASSESAVTFLFANSWTIWVLAIVELALVWGISSAIDKLSTPVATTLFYVYAAVNGLTLSVIFLAYTMTSIASTFFVTAATFGAMSAYGYFTKADLSKMGSIMFMALIGLIIASIVNIFLGSTMLEWIITIAGVAIFVGLTAWDTQKIKELAEMTDVSQTGKLSTIGALRLYLDFINLFIYLLRILGSSRN